MNVECIHCVATNFNRQRERTWCLVITHTTSAQMNLKICAVGFEKRMDTVKICLLQALIVSRSETVVTKMGGVCVLFSKRTL